MTSDNSGQRVHVDVEEEQSGNPDQEKDIVATKFQ